MVKERCASVSGGYSRHPIPTVRLGCRETGSGGSNQEQKGKLPSDCRNIEPVALLTVFVRASGPTYGKRNQFMRETVYNWILISVIMAAVFIAAFSKYSAQHLRASRHHGSVGIGWLSARN